MSFEQPKQSREELKGITEKISLISEQLKKRKAEGQNNLFSPDSEVFFENLSQKLQSIEGDDFSQIADDFENEVREFNKHTGGIVIDSLDSIAKTSAMFTDLSEEVQRLNISGNPDLERISRLSQSVSDILEKKRQILDRYLNN